MGDLVVVFVLAGVALFFAAGGGIGGGGLLVPLYILVGGWDATHAVALSNATILGGSVANLLLNLMQRHPLADRPLISFDLMLVMEPMTMLGAVGGTLLNAVLPSWMTCALLVALLGATTDRTLKKGVRLFRKENAEKETERCSLLAASNIISAHSQPEKAKIMGHRRTMTSPDLPQPYVTDTSTGHRRVHTYPRVNNSCPHLNAGGQKLLLNAMFDFAPASHLEKVYSESRFHSDALLSQHQVKAMGSGYAEANGDEELVPDVARAKLYAKEKRALPCERIAVMAVLTIVSLAISLSKKNVDKYGDTYWALTALYAVLVLVFTWGVRCVLLREGAEKEKCAYEHAPGDVMWDASSTVKYPLWCASAGVCAGLFGIGGGIVKGPLMLEMGVLPEVAAATSATMIFFTTSAATASYAAAGTLLLDAALPLMLVGLVATAAGQIAMSWILKKTQRASLLVLLIGTIIGFSTIAMGAESVIALLAARDSTSSHEAPTDALIR